MVGSHQKCCGAFALTTLTLVYAAAVHAEESVDDFRAKMEKWVKTRQIVSEEQADWEVERESLKATKRLLAQQREALEVEIADLEGSNTAADDERREFLLQRADYQRSSQVLAERIRAMEEQVLNLNQRFPAPLQKRLEPLIVQIPENPDISKIPLGRRLMNVLGVLAQAEKFNDTVTLAAETRAVDGEQKVQIRTLYWGLGEAIYVDSAADNAGIGHPGDEGWVFTADSALADDAKRLVDIYEGNVDAIEFVSLPAAVR